MSVPTCVWTGASGQKYTYHVYPFGQSFASVPGNYALTIRDSKGTHTILYFGQSCDLEQRCCDTHHKWQDAIKKGATHIQAHKSSADEGVRCAEERDLIGRYKPPLNDR